MSMTLAEGTAAVRAMLNEPSAVGCTDAQIENWLHLGGRDVCTKVLCNRENETVYVPANDLSTELNCLADAILSGTPRICVSESHYFKVLPTKSGVETPPTDPAAWKTYDNATLSGTPKRLGFSYGGYLYWVKGYPTPAATNNPTGDAIQNLVYDVPDDAVAGAPNLFRILSGGAYYYFKAYRIANYAQCDEILTLPLDADTLKLISVARTPDGGKPRGLMNIHPEKVGHINGSASGDPRFFWEFAKQLGLVPGGGSAGFALNVHRACFVDAFTDVPDDLQPPCLYYAYVMACYKAGKFKTAAVVYKSYLQTLMSIRKWIYEMEKDGKGDMRIPDSIVKVARKKRAQARRKQ
jgi:hypothetical protein